MFPELHAIERTCSRTPGSIKSIVLIDPGDLASQPDWHLLPSIDDLDFSPGAGAYAFETDRLTSRLDDSTPDDNAGDFFRYNLTARLRTVRAEVELLRAKIVNRPLHVVATYYNDEQRFVPNMRLRFTGDSADRPSGRNGYQVTGTARLLKPAPFLNATVDVIGGPYVPPDPTDIGSGVTLVELTVTDPTSSYAIPSGKWLVGIEIRSTDAQTASVGLTAMGEELGGPNEMDALQVWTVEGNSVPTFTSSTIYFSGLEGTNSIKLWLLG